MGAPAISQTVVFIFGLAFLCAPLTWLLPRAIAIEAIGALTILVLAIFAPETAAWFIAITILTHSAMRLGDRVNHQGVIVSLAIVLILTGFVVSETAAGYVRIGLSFFCLRLLHVLAEWWIGKLATPNFRDFVRYLFFLPVLIVGPIHRFPNFQRQVMRRRFDWPEFLTGMERCLIGLFMAYFLGEVVFGKTFEGARNWFGADRTFAAAWSLSAISWIQLFFVFAGLSSLALGISAMMGLTLEENFNKPWRAASLLDFWNRWHMSLTSWSRDYAFRPVMAVSRSPVMGLIAAMIVIGLWHALSLYYLLWSFWQALGIILSRQAGHVWPPDRVPEFLRKPLILLGILGWLSLASPVINLVLRVSDDAPLSFF